MIRLDEIGATIRQRREELGLSVEQLSAFGDMETGTLLELENGALLDIGYNQLAILLQLLSFSFESLGMAARLSKRGLWMAAKNVSVSYRNEVSPQILLAVLRNGNCPPEYVSNIGYFLDETPLELVIMAVEEAAEDPETRSNIWRNMASLAQRHGFARNMLWLEGRTPRGKPM